MIEDLLKTDRKLEMEFQYQLAHLSDGEGWIIEKTLAYLNRYLEYNHLSNADVAASYANTIKRYSADIKTFCQSGKYPFELTSGTVGSLSRVDYDLFLMLSILLTRHRLQVAKEVSLAEADSGRTLVIGVGSGVELNFIPATAHIAAYDPTINPFVRAYFATYEFHESLYQFTGPQYRTIFAIELLEHLEDPFAFLEHCHRSLEPEGQLVVTTARNVPQFDHVYNFASDGEFENRLAEIGFRVTYRNEIPHRYMLADIGAGNVFYRLKRT